MSAESDLSLSLQAAWKRHYGPATVGAYSAGQHVEAQWTDGKWYGATVQEVDPQRAKVAWDDGTAPSWLPLAQVRLPPGGGSYMPGTGDRIQAQRPSGVWISATVKDADQEKGFLVVWDDGSPESYVARWQVRPLATTAPKINPSTNKPWTVDPESIPPGGDAPKPAPKTHSAKPAAPKKSAAPSPPPAQSAHLPKLRKPSGDTVSTVIGIGALIGAGALVVYSFLGGKRRP